MAPAIDARIRDFLSTFPEIIRNTPASAFENFRSGAASDVAETDKVDQFYDMRHEVPAASASSDAVFVACVAECQGALSPLVGRAVHASPIVEAA